MEIILEITLILIAMSIFIGMWVLQYLGIFIVEYFLANTKARWPGLFIPCVHATVILLSLTSFGRGGVGFFFFNILFLAGEVLVFIYAPRIRAYLRGRKQRKKGVPQSVPELPPILPGAPIPPHYPMNDLNVPTYTREP